MKAVIPIESYPCKNGMDFESNGAASLLNCALAQANEKNPAGNVAGRQISVTEAAPRDT